MGNLQQTDYPAQKAIKNATPPLSAIQNENGERYP